MADPSFVFKVEIKMPTPDTAYKAGFMLLREIYNELTGDRTGRWYPLPGNVHYEKSTPKDSGLRAANYSVKYTGTRNRDEIMGAAYQASAPGEPPASRTGRLRNSFYMIVEKAEMGLDYICSVRTTVTYADDLESGAERLQPRPFIQPAIDRLIESWRDLYANTTYELIRRGA